MLVNHTFVFLLCLAFSEWLEDLLPFYSFRESLGLHFLLVPIRTNVRKIFNNFTFAEIRLHMKKLSVHTHTIHMFRQHSVFFFLALVFVILWTTKYGFFHSFINQHVTHFKSRLYMISSLSTFRLVLNFIISSFICLHYATLPEGTKNTKPLQLIMMHWGVFKLVRDRIEHTLLRFMIHEWARHSLKLCANPIGHYGNHNFFPLTNT